MNSSKLENSIREFKCTTADCKIVTKICKARQTLCQCSKIDRRTFRLWYRYRQLKFSCSWTHRNSSF